MQAKGSDSKLGGLGESWAGLTWARGLGGLRLEQCGGLREVG